MKCTAKTTSSESVRNKEEMNVRCWSVAGLHVVGKGTEGGGGVEQEQRGEKRAGAEKMALPGSRFCNTITSSFIVYFVVSLKDIKEMPRKYIYLCSVLCCCCCAAAAAHAAVVVAVTLPSSQP